MLLGAGQQKNGKVVLKRNVWWSILQISRFVGKRSVRLVIKSLIEGQTFVEVKVNKGSLICQKGKKLICKIVEEISKLCSSM